MRFLIKVPGVGEFKRLMPSARAAQAWAALCWPEAFPASVTCCQRGGA